MRKDIRLGFKLLRYSYKFKVNVLIICFFVLIGVLMIFSNVEGFLLGSIYLFLGPIMMLQMNYSLMHAQLVSVSNRRRFLELTFPNLVSCISGVLLYLTLSVLACVFAGLRPQQKTTYSISIIFVSIIIVICMIYYGICYKYFIFGTILFACTFSAFYVFFRESLILFFMRTVGVNILTTFSIGLVIILAGCVVSCLLRRAFYRKPVSRLSLGANLRKAMQ